MISNVAVTQKIWRAYFGDLPETYDAFGELIIFLSHGTGIDVDGSWEIDWIQPLSKGGAEVFSNTQILSTKSILQKGEKTEGVISLLNFKVVKYRDHMRMYTESTMIEGYVKAWAYKEPLF